MATTNRGWQGQTPENGHLTRITIEISYKIYSTAHQQVRATQRGGLSCFRCLLCRCSLERARGQTPSLVGGGCAGAAPPRTRKTSPACRRTCTARARSGTRRHAHPARRTRGGAAAVAMPQLVVRSEPLHRGAGRSGAAQGRLVVAPDCRAAPRRSRGPCLRAIGREGWFAQGCFLMVKGGGIGGYGAWLWRLARPWRLAPEAAYFLRVVGLLPESGRPTS